MGSALLKESSNRDSSKRGDIVDKDGNVVLNLRTHSVSFDGSFKLSGRGNSMSLVPESWCEMIEAIEVKQQGQLAGEWSLISTFKQKSLLGSDGQFNRLFGQVMDQNGNVKILGSGMEGEVMLVQRKSDKRLYALKTVSLDDDYVQSRADSFELSRLTCLDHPRIVKIHDVFTQKKSFLITFEVGTGGDLFHYVKTHGKLPDEKIRSFAKQMLTAVQYLQLKGVVHRDIKLDNFVFREDPDESDDIFLIDFGLACQLSETMPTRKEMCGTIHYMSPEMHQGEYSFPTDMFSIGVVIFMMATGRRPFRGKTDEEIVKNVMKGRYTLAKEHWDERPPELRDLVERLLDSNPKTRASPTEALNHPFFIPPALEGEGESEWSDVLPAEVLSDVLESLKRFCTYPYLKQLALQIIAHDCPFEKAKLFIPVFDTLKEDNSAVITLQSVKKVIPELILGATDLVQLFVALDRDVKGYLTWTELVAALLPLEYYRNDKYILFRVYQKLTFPYQRNVITSDDLKYLLGTGCSNDDIETIISQAKAVLGKGGSKSNDKTIGWADFVHMMRFCYHRSSTSVLASIERHSSLEIVKNPPVANNTEEKGENDSDEKKQAVEPQQQEKERPSSQLAEGGEKQDQTREAVVQAATAT